MATDKGMTVNELLEFCKIQVKKGNGAKHIQVSMDDEGNGFHSLFYQFSDDKADLQYYLNEGMMPYGIDSIENIILLG